MGTGTAKLDTQHLMEFHLSGSPVLLSRFIFCLFGFFLGGGYQAQIYFAYGFSLLLHHLMPLFHLVLRNCIFSSRLRMKGKICNKGGWCCGFCCCYSEVIATVSACCCCHVGLRGRMCSFNHIHGLTRKGRQTISSITSLYEQL